METRNVYQKFIKAKADFHNTTMTKSGENKFSKFKYFELGDIIPVAIKCLTENGLVSETTFTKETASLIITNVDTPSEKIEFSLDLTEAVLDLKGSQAIQGLGAKITYIRRYLLQIAFDIIEQDAIDKELILTPEDKAKKDDEKVQLKAVLAEVDTLAKECGKLDRDGTSMAIKKYHNSANFNTIKSLEIANKVLEELTEFKKGVK